ncbi:MAG: hypothetical protein J5565_00755 [Muribaculaceae bacterium]|nr:hypothetical protein [Muribaculaceae bacterium]
MKKTLLLLVAVLASLSAWAQQNVVTTVTTHENVTKNSTVYVGEVVVDGSSVIKYLYSDDVTDSYGLIKDLSDCLDGMADGDYAVMLAGQEFDYNLHPEAQGFAICSNADLIAAMDANWSSAQYVGTLYYPDKSVTSTVNSNLYDLDEGFKAVLDAQTEERASIIDNPVDAENCIVTHITVNSTDNVYFTVENGEIIKHVDTNVYYSCELTTVMYTKAELKTTVTGVEDINAAQPCSGQRYNVMGQPVGKGYKGIVIEDGKKLVIK